MPAPMCPRPMNPTSMISCPPPTFVLASGVPPVRHVCRRIDRDEPTDLIRPAPQPGIEVASGSTAEGTAMARNITLLDIVNAVAEYSRSEAELIATVVYMVNEGHVRLCGTFKGSRFDLTSVAA